MTVQYAHFQYDIVRLTRKTGLVSDPCGRLVARHNDVIHSTFTVCATKWTFFLSPA